MTDDHVSDAFDRLLATYGEPRTENIDGFEAEFRATVHGFAPKLLQQAVTRWIRKDTPFWPRPGELAAECVRVYNDTVRPLAMADGANVNADPRPPQTPAQREAVRRMVADAMQFLASPQTAIDDAGVDWSSGQQPAFEAMQASSRNTMHRRRELTPLTKRMTGDDR